MQRTVRVITIIAATAAAAGLSAVPATAGAAARTTIQRASCNHPATPGATSCFLFTRVDGNPDLTSNTPPVGAYTPSDLQAAYGLTSAAANDGSGERVYIADAFNDPNIDSDLSAYRTQYSLGPCTEASGCLQVLNQSGNASPLPPAPSGSDDWTSETSLQVDMVSAICPSCGITVMEANDDTSDGLYIETQKAAELGAKFVSLPWGGSDSANSTNSDAQYDGYFSPTGVVYAVAAGDNGYGTGSYPGGPTYPAASPNVVAVGGTTLTDDAGSFSQSAWVGGQSGCSTHESQPSWQAAIIPSATCAGRAEDDVSAIANPDDGVAMYDSYGSNGGWQAAGGTSVSAPVIAATFALAGTPAPTEVPAALMYQNAAGLRDVTSGHDGTCPSDTLLCTAATGWDGPTGNGTPNGLAAFMPPATDHSGVTIGKSTTAAFGHKVPVKTTLTDSKTKAPIGSASIKLLAKPAGAKAFVLVKTVKTRSDGTASFAVDPVYNTQFKWEYDGAGVHDPVTSRVQTIDVEALTDLVATKKVGVGKTIKIGLVVGPGQHGQKVTLQRKVGKSWHKVTVATLTTSEKSRGVVVWVHIFKTQESKAGKYQFRTLVAKTSRNAAATSKSVTVKVT